MSQSAREDTVATLDLMDTRNKEQLVLSQLLSKLRQRRGHHLALRVHMGEVSSYLTSATLEWVTAKVRLASELPIFVESVEGSTRLPADHATRAPIQRCGPDWSRQVDMAAYLATRRHHKFPPLLVVAYQRWVHEPRHEKWGVYARAMNDSLTLSGLETSGTYCYLDDAHTTFYAFGGLHRLIAILGLHELVQTGQLHAFDRERNPTSGGGLSRDEIVNRIHVGTGESPSDIRKRLQRLMDEEIGIEVVPAVCEGESYIEALQRLRRLLVDVNRNAAGS